MRSLFGVVVAAFVVACSGGPAPEGEGTSAIVTNEPVAKTAADCAPAKTIPSCLEIKGCSYFGDAPAGHPHCVYTGVIVPQPGSGDPGGGGSVAADDPDSTLPVDIVAEDTKQKP